jgi:threonine dehydrogenase-like Zn-dependent dehydrogenase
MKAAYLLKSRIEVGEMPDPVPAKGQALVRTHSCGLCASDVHFLHSGEKVVAMSKQFGGPYANVDLSKPFVPGHEFVGEILDYGPGSRRPLKPGTKVTALPVMRTEGGIGIIGYSDAYPGGFGETMLLDENFMLEVPADLDDDMAAMTEPLAVGLEHARSGEPKSGEVPLVIGCGAIGLGVIAGLKLMGIAPIVAADLDANRRDIAIQMGADVAVDPRELSPYRPLHELGDRSPNLVYECVGKRGMVNEIIHSVGFGARIVIGGFCLEPEEIYVPSAQSRRLKIFFAAGEEPQDLELALRSIANGKIDIRPWLGARIGLGGVGAALDEMRNPSAPVRTVVDPRRM